MALPLLLIAIFFALRVMPAKGTSWLVHVDVGLAWFSALSAMVLVPTDVSTTLEVPFIVVTECRSPTLESEETRGLKNVNMLQNAYTQLDLDNPTCR